MLRWQNLMVSGAMARWRDAAAERKRLESISMRVMRRWRGLDLNLAWLGWLDLIQQAHEERKAKDEAEQEGLQQVADLLNDALSTANDELNLVRVENSRLLRSSSQMAEALGAHRERMLARVAGRLLHRGRARAFGRWEESTRASREMKRKAGVVMRRWKHRELAMAYRSWLGTFALSTFVPPSDIVFDSPLPSTAFSSRKNHVPVTSFSSRRRTSDRSSQSPALDAPSNPIDPPNQDLIGSVLPFPPHFRSWRY